MAHFILKELYDNFKNHVDKDITVKGWTKSIRKSKNISFLIINDGSSIDDFQIIIDNDKECASLVDEITIGSAVGITGLVVESQGKQDVEMQAKSIEIFGKTDETYPLQKKSTSVEFLREKAHLRARTNTFSNVFRVRHELAMATHNFFNNKSFYYLHTPIITTSDCEGAGELFRVSTLDPQKLPLTDKGLVDYSEDYFGQEAFLAVSGQLQAESFALSMGRVYTFGPTFRSENSQTSRHLSEFWMIEPEMAFMDLEQDAQLAQEFLQHLIKHALEKCPKELAFFDRFYQKGLIQNLEHVANSDFEKITYTDAVNELAKSSKKFEYKVQWGADLQTEHERFLTEECFKKPVIVTDYPKDIKAFYMKQSEDGKTVRAMDVLVPGVGEIIGGSQREDDLGLLKQRMKEMNLSEQEYWWYLELRKFGGAPHSGFGLGFERAIMYITGMSNIRDVIAFPRFPKHAQF